MMGESIEEGIEYELRVDAKGAHGEGIGRIGEITVFVQNAKTRIGNKYKVKITKLHRTFAYAELSDNSGKYVGNGSLLDLTITA
ncbi:MAG: TRAM domain-containing protein [Candidatus Micrarchaeia archaeon]